MYDIRIKMIDTYQSILTIVFYKVLHANIAKNVLPENYCYNNINILQGTCFLQCAAQVDSTDHRRTYLICSVECHNQYYVNDE